MSTHPSLLSIDVAAEIRKVCGQQFSSPAERLVELIRTVVRFGARAVRVQVGMRWATVDTIGGTIPPVVIEYLSALADPRLSSTQRHAALLGCEADHALGLMGLLAAPSAVVHAASGAGQVRLSLRPDAPPVIDGGSDMAPGIRIRVARRGRRHEEMRAVRTACRFAGLPVFLSGRQISAGMRTGDCLLEAAARSGSLECRVGLPRTGELCQTTTLCHEIVARESYSLSRRGFVHLAVVRDRAAISPARIRASRATALVNSTRETLYRRLREALPGLPLADRRIARNLLFRRCERTGTIAHVSGLRLFRLLSGDVVDVESVRATAREGAIWAIEPGSPRRRWLVPASEVFVFDAKARDFVGKHLALRMLQPPALSKDTVGSRARRALRRSIRWAHSAARLVAARIAGVQPLAHAMLAPIERQLVGALQAEISGGRYAVPGLTRDVSREVRVYMARRGSLPLRLRRVAGGWCVLLPRRHPQIVRMVTALHRDPASLYPSLAVLFGGHDGFGKRKAALQEALISAGAP